MKLKQIICLFFCSVLRIAAQDLILNEQEYFAAPALSVLAFHNVYPVGMQGGIEIIQHNARIATNGNLQFRLNQTTAAIPGVDFFHEPIPKIDNPPREIDRTKNQIKLPFNYPKIDLKYHILVRAGNNGAFSVEVNFETPVIETLFEEIAFEILLYPEAFAGKSFLSESGAGTFPFDFVTRVEYEGDREWVEPLLTGKKIVLAAEDSLLKMIIVSHSGVMQLIDDRWSGRRQWFKLLAKADLTRTAKVVSLTFSPNIVKDWVKPPQILVSQVGYHPDQPKHAIIELQQGTQTPEPVRLLKLEPDTQFHEVERNVPQIWGNYLRYTYAIYDFTKIETPGLYCIQSGKVRTHLFKIAADVFRQGVWQPVLATFLPVQMCHVSVRDRGHVWHSACHLDDALQAPAPLAFFDGFQQSEKTETLFAPKTNIPGLNVGGWHDAGDDDINTGSSGATIYHLALAIDEFGVDLDQTTVDFKKREVHLHRPDGISDALQQVIHGIHWLLAQYRQVDHSIVGVISSDWATYVQTADWGVFTDNLFYHPEMQPTEKDGQFSGRFDDRYAFTNKDSRREYFVAAVFAASSRVLKDSADSLAAECLANARKIWQFEENHPPVFYASVGTPHNLVVERTKAAVELYLTTGENQFLEAILQKREEILTEIRETGWLVSRVIDRIPDQKFRQDFEERLAQDSQLFAAGLAKNPFGVKSNAHIWGIGWNLLWQAQQDYFLIRKYPHLYPPKQLFNAIHYCLGVHPGSNISLVSSVGTHRPIPAFGINRSDYAYIPGGVFSGTSTILPDFPELKSDHPFLWQQSEYMVWGATPFLFCVLAADQLLNQRSQSERKKLK